MSNFQKIISILKSVLMILIGLTMIISPSIGYVILILILELWLLIYGIKLLVYYFSMARYKVGGLKTLYKSIIVIDLALLCFSLSTAHQKLVMVILVISIAFEGIVYIMKAMKSKAVQSSSWKSQLLRGMLHFGIAILCIIFIDSTKISTILFGIGLIASAVSDIITTTKKTEIIYIG